jgi:hypothetical protein
MEPRWRMSGSIPPTSHMPSCRPQGQLCFYVLCTKLELAAHKGLRCKGLLSFKRVCVWGSHWVSQSIGLQCAARLLCEPMRYQDNPWQSDASCSPIVRQCRSNGKQSEARWMHSTSGVTLGKRVVIGNHGALKTIRGLSGISRSMRSIWTKMRPSCIVKFLILRTTRFNINKFCPKRVLGIVVNNRRVNRDAPHSR